MTKPPILVLGKTGRVYVVTDYTFHANGVVIPLAKYDVTGQFEIICKNRTTGTEVATGNLSPPQGGRDGRNQDRARPVPSRNAVVVAG